MNPSLPLSIGLAALIAIGAAMLWAQSPTANSGAATAAAIDPLQIHAELARLRRDLEQIATSPTTTVPAGDVADAETLERILARLTEAEAQLEHIGSLPGEPSRRQDPETPSITTPEAREQLLQRQVARAEALQRTLESRFYDEPADPHWARQAQEDISRSLQDPAFSGNQIGDLDCQASLCRLQVHSADPGAQERFLANYGNSPAFADTQAFWKRDDRPDGSSLTTLYVMRPGNALPDIGPLEP